MKKPTEYIKEAWFIYTKKENFIFFARIMAVLTILSTIVGFVTGYFFPNNSNLESFDYSNTLNLVAMITTSIIAAFIGLWSQTTSYYSIIKMGKPEKEIFKIGYKKIGKFLLISLTLGIIIVFGAVLLIIPAVIFGTWYSFSILLVLDRNLSIKDALKTSKQMVNGKFWKVLGRSAVFGLFTFLVSIVLSIIPYVGSFALSFVAPLFLLPSYLLYQDLELNK